MNRQNSHTPWILHDPKAADPANPYRASCTCGHKGPHYAQPAQALRAATAHAAYHTTH